MFAVKRYSSTKSVTPSGKEIWNRIKSRPIEYLSIPCVAAFVAISTNWVGVKMLFYPIQYFGIDWKRWPDTPYGLFGWQGVVPTKTEIMARRLVKIVTTRLLSLEEAFGRLDPTTLGGLLRAPIQEAIERDCGSIWAAIMKPVLPILLPLIVKRLQVEIDQVLDLDQIVLEAFVRDKAVLVDLFQKVGRVELQFLVNSGFAIGFVLGLAQMVGWARYPIPWTLPAAGAVVGYVTSWIAIKLLFEPAEPVNIGNLFVIQGLFESRQVEVSDEFGQFMNERVLNSRSLLQDLSSGEDQGDLYAFLRRHLPYPIPSHILKAAVAGMADIAENPQMYPHVHRYVSEKLDIEKTLARRLKTLTPIEFEDLLHPVFQEDEITLIATGGVLGWIAGALQTQLGWGVANAKSRAIGTIAFTLISSLALYAHQKYEEVMDEPLASHERPQLQRRETILRTPLTTDPGPAPIMETLEHAIEKTVEQIVPTVVAVKGHLPDVPGIVRRTTWKGDDEKK
jgi:uncharacterized membrane protein YheB (UPF0754 family)